MGLFGARVLCLLTLYSTVTLAQSSGVQADAQGELRLEVTDASGAPVAAACLLERADAAVKLRFRTNAGGKHTQSALPRGRYRLQISKDGFASYAASLVIENSQPVTLRVKLEIGVSAYSVDVVSATPLAGVDRNLDEIPAPVQTATARDLEASGALDLSSFLNQRLQGVYLNEIQGNPLQPDLNYRGYTASPLLGTPQGVSVYMDGVRLNQPFGDVVSWDLIPRMAISEVALIPGSNPLFGLNTLGGAISLRTKDGVSHPGTSLQLLGGSFGRRLAEMEHGGSNAKGLHWFLAGNLLFEDGWRETSPSSARQLFSRLGWQRQRTSIGLTLAYVNNGLIGNGIQEQSFLDRDYRSVYTKPDLTAHRAPFTALNARHSLTSRLTLAANVYFRYVRTRTLNGDINEESLDQSLYQPNAAERNALAAAGFTGFPLSGESAANTPFPRWRCIANVLLRDEPSEKCNGLINRSFSHQRNYGLSGQLSWSGTRATLKHQLTAGAAYDGNSVGFEQSTELGYLNPDRSVTGLGAFGDGVTGGDADGEPFDTRVNLSGRIHSTSAYATDTMSYRNLLHLTLSGRFNHTTIHNRDLIRPTAGTGSLTGRHSFNRFNPAVGATYRLRPALSFYAGYTEGNRAPTSIELGCADPNAPCRLPNALAGDPPLGQVTTRTVEAGVRGAGEGSLRWSAGWFRADNRNDILFVASEQTGFGYFRNFGKTLRQGAEFDVSARIRRIQLGAGYTLLDATFQSPEEVNGTGNSTNEEAQDGVPGTEGAIKIQPGNRIPLVPRHVVKAYADAQLTRKLLTSVSVLGMSSSFARGNENNQHRPDGRYYLGNGSSPGYAVVNLGARYELAPLLQVFVQVNNLFNRRYFTAAQLGPTGFTGSGEFIARPFPTILGEFPVRQSTFFAPGAPRGVWIGTRWRF
ncbi:MAG: TonB-dependent receptor [Bryobacterales bacterium]|nr:TonB-dependent receptor [Bryobacterales bacterium]